MRDNDDGRKKNAQAALSISSAVQIVIAWEYSWVMTHDFTLFAFSSSNFPNWKMGRSVHGE